MLFCPVAVHVARRFSNGRPSMQAAVQGHLGRMNYVVVKMVDLASESAALPANEQDSTRGAELSLQIATPKDGKRLLVTGVTGQLVDQAVRCHSMQVAFEKVCSSKCRRP